MGYAIDCSSEPSPASRSTTRTSSPQADPGWAGGSQQVSQGQVVDRHGGGGRAAQRPLSRCADPPGPGAARRRASRGGRGLGGERGDGADGRGRTNHAVGPPAGLVTTLRALGARLAAGARSLGGSLTVDPLGAAGRARRDRRAAPPRLDEYGGGVAAAPRQRGDGSALTLARADDVALLPAWLSSPGRRWIRGSPWEGALGGAARQRPRRPGATARVAGGLVAG